jgi:hypothetical protein
MTENLDHSRDGSSEAGLPVAGHRPSSDATLLARRRKFLAGSLATSSFVATLASRTALADTVCTVSGFHSLHPSQADETTLKCGDSPGCWKNTNFNLWAAPFKKRDGTFTIYTHTTIIGQVSGLTDGTTGFGNPIWTNAQTLQLQQMINGTGLTLKFHGTNTSFTAISGGQAANIAAGLLNETFFGADAVGFDALNYIQTAVSNADTAAADTSQTVTQRETTIKGIFSTLDATIGTYPHDLCGTSGLF